jgi:hypothetical protein
MKTIDTPNEVQANDVEDRDDDVNNHDSVVVLPLPARCSLWPEETVQALVDTTASVFWDYVVQSFEREEPNNGGATFAEVVKTVTAYDPTVLHNRTLIILDFPAPLVPDVSDVVLPKDMEDEMWMVFEECAAAEARSAVAKIRGDLSAGVYKQ